MQIESQSNLRKSRGRRASISNLSNKENQDPKTLVSKKRQPQFETTSKLKPLKKMKVVPEGSTFLSRLHQDVQALQEVKVPQKIQPKSSKAPFNATIDYGNFKKLPEKQRQSRSQEKKVLHQVSPEKQERPPPEMKPRRSMSAPRSPANYQMCRQNYSERKETGNLRPWEIKKENYIQGLLKQSEPVGNPIQKNTRNKNGALKILDYSKSTLNASQTENLQVDRLKIAKRLGQIDFSFDNDHVRNIDQSIYFENDEQSRGIKEKIEFQQKVEKLKKIADDSRLDDSRKYLMNADTPEFGDKSEEPQNENSILEEVSEDSVLTKVTEFLNLQLKESQI